MAARRHLLITRLLLVVLLCVLCLDNKQISENPAERGSHHQLIDMSLEELMEVEVTTSA